MEKLNIASETEVDSSKNPEQRIERVFYGTTKDGATVYDRVDSHFHAEGGLTPEILEEAINNIDTGGRNFIKEVIEFDRPIGERTCVDTGPEDEIVMVYRKGRSGQTPMVKNRKSEPCNLITVILKKDHAVQDGNTYEIATSYVGNGSPKEPWDPNLNSDEEKKGSEDFWSSHALIYDDSLIDWEKTKGFEFMSEPAKMAESIRQRTVFTGVFVDSEDLYQKKIPTLAKPIEYPHITIAFKPDIAELNLEEIGTEVKIFAIGYGNDGDNEGLLVKIKTGNPTVQEICDNLETPHITLSLSEKGQAKNAAMLNFAPLDRPFELSGEYGLFSQGKVIQNQTDLAKLEEQITNCQHHFDKKQ